MKKLSLSILIIVILLATPGAALAGSGPEYEANLTGSQEVPPVATSMKGKVEFVLKDGTLKFKLRVRNNTNEIFAAHIHCAPPGVNGPVGVTLFSGSFTSSNGFLARGTISDPVPANACGWASVAAIVSAMESGNAYVNVHTTAASGGVPSGEIRGDLTADDDN